MNLDARNKEAMKVNISEVYMDEEIKKTVLETLDSGWYTLGQRLKTFESKFAEFIGTKYAVGVNSGTAAIQVALMSINVGKDDEVIVPSNTTIPTIEPILWCGARPIFAEVDPVSFTLDPSSVKERITEKTKAIMPVHLYGHPSKVDELQEICENNGLLLVEDCAQAHGALFMKKKVGSFGKFGCFSFYPSKNVTVCGEGGMVTTNDEEMFGKMLMIRNHGMTDRYKHVLLGYNFRLGEIEATIGAKQLEHLQEFNTKRRKWAKLYGELLGSSDFLLPTEMDWAYHVYHLYVIRSRWRDQLAAYLSQRGVGTAIHYPIPCHLQPMMSGFPKVRLEVTERIANEILSLPMHPQLSEERVQYVADSIKQFQKTIS